MTRWTQEYEAEIQEEDKDGDVWVVFTEYGNEQKTKVRE